MADQARNDKVIVKGHGRADGEYVVDLRALLNIGTAGSLNILEQNEVFTVSGVRPAGLPQAFLELDAMVMVALARIILGRHGKTVKVESLMQGHLAYSDGQEDTDPLADISKGLLYVVDNAEEAEDEEDGDGDAAVPPAEAPTEPSEQPSRSGGESTSLSLAPPANDPSRTGHPDSPTSATSDPETLAG